MAVVQVAATTPVLGVVGRAWTQAAEVVAEGLTPPLAWARGVVGSIRGRVRDLAWPWAAWTVLLSPARWWTEAFVALTLGDERRRPGAVRSALGAGRAVAQILAASLNAAVRGWAARRATRSAGPRRRRLTPRRAFRGLVWTVVVTQVGLFAASLAVPLWYQLHGQRLLIVTSGSMSPFVEAGDVVVLQTISDPSQLRVGQVATFWPPGSTHLVTHRIVDLRMLPAVVKGADGQVVAQTDAAGNVVERPYIYTKGDANATRDPDATPLGRVSGVVVGAHAGWGITLAWAQSPAGRFTLLAPPLLLLGALELVDLLAERRQQAKRPVRATRPEVNDALGLV